MFAIAVFACFFLLSRQAKKQGLNPETVVDFVFWSLVSGIIGARLFYFFLNFPFYQDNPREIFMLWHGGLVWYGGLIASFVFGISYLKVKQLPILKILDLVAPYIALGQSIGRVGCFLNGCCFGKPFSFGVYFPVHQMKLFPVQLLSALNLFLVFVFLMQRDKKPHRAGEILFQYLILAALERFGVEFFRGDSPALIWNLTIFQVISLFIFALALYGEIFLKSRRGF